MGLQHAGWRWELYLPRSRLWMQGKTRKRDCLRVQPLKLASLDAGSQLRRGLTNESFGQTLSCRGGSNHCRHELWFCANLGSSSSIATGPTREPDRGISEASASQMARVSFVL